MTDPSMDQPYRYQYPQAPYGPPPPAYPVSGTPYQVSVTPYQPATGALQPVSAYPYPVTPAVLPAGMPAAPYGFDPLTGLPYSDKSKVVAGVLQLFLGGFAIGRFYTGHVGLAFGQLAAVWVPALFLCCVGTLLSMVGGFVLWVAMPLGTLWPVIDGIVLLVRGGTDAQGRVLRG